MSLPVSRPNSLKPVVGITATFPYGKLDESPQRNPMQNDLSPTDALRRWVEVWERAGAELERIRIRELRHLDVARALELLTGPADYFSPPYAPKPYSGLVEQQAWFLKARPHA